MANDEQTGGLIHLPTAEPQTSQWEDEGFKGADSSRIPDAELRNSGRGWPDFAIGDRMMVKGCLFQVVDFVRGALVIKPFVGRVAPDEAKRIVADMIPKR